MLEAKHNLLLMNNVDDRKKLFDTVKKFVYLNASAIMVLAMFLFRHWN